MVIKRKIVLLILLSCTYFISFLGAGDALNRVINKGGLSVIAMCVLCEVDASASIVAVPITAFVDVCSDGAIEDCLERECGCSGALKRSSAWALKYKI